MPYAPAFETTPESRPDTSGGASRYASGTQPWKGYSGALIANAAMKARNSQRESLVPTPARSNVPARSPSVITPTSMSSEPTSV